MSSRRALALLAMLCLAPTSEAGVTAERTRLVFVEGQREASLLLVNQNPYPVLVQAWVDDGALALDHLDDHRRRQLHAAFR
ncbi:molecular chaperone, partial [Pseudomonas aeruginosa]|uniref:fimbria/pilus periplasmic chaperone n=1 Tax=Pseudomonas aeruginosa TaxID=287 RepID=UPI0012485D7E